MKECYEKELKKAVEKFQKKDFSFAVVADSHLDDSIEDFWKNLSSVSNALKLDCVVHLGDIMNGNFSKSYTEKILKEQIEGYRKSVSCPFYPVEGNHDGYFDGECNDVATDEIWENATKYLDSDKNVIRPKGKPYYYIDFPDKKIRFVGICSFCYEYKNGKFNKIYGISDEQVKWLDREGFNAPEGWNLFVLSHDTPFENYFEPISEQNQRINGYNTFLALEKNKKKNGFSVGAWFVGHEHGDFLGKISGVNFILTASETAYVPSLWPMTGNGVFPKRELGTETEDAFDIVSVDLAEKTLLLTRFGAGEDRKARWGD